MDKVEVKEVIVCTKERRGSGIVKHSPVRVITEVCDFKGDVIAEHDPVGDIAPEAILDFLKHHYSDIETCEHIAKIYAYFIEDEG